MSVTLPGALLIHKITIIRQSRGFAPGTKQPIVTESTIGTGIRARFEPLSGSARETVLGRIPEATHKLFLNVANLKQDDIVEDEATLQQFTVREVGDFFGHHMEAILEEKRD